MSATELPNGWVRAKLSQLGTWSGGGTPSKTNPEYWDDGDVPWVSPKDMKQIVLAGSIDHITEAAVEETVVRKAAAGSLAFVVRSGILEHTLPVALVPFEATYNQDMRVLAPSTLLNARWLLYALLAEAETIRRACRKDGTTVASIDIARMSEYEIPLPPRAEQDRIVERVEIALSSLVDALRETVRAEEMVETFSRAALVGAVRGTTQAPASGSSNPVADILQTRRNRWEEAELARLTAAGKKPKNDSWKAKYKHPTEPDTERLPLQVPDRWAIASLEAITDPVRVICYGILKPKVAGVSDVPYVEVKDLRDRANLSPDTLHKTSRQLHEEFARSTLAAGDVLVAIRGSYDRCQVVPAALEGANISRDVARVAPLPGIDSAYLQVYLSSPVAQTYLDKVARGVAVRGINIGDLRQMPVPVPPHDVQLAIVRGVNRQLALANTLADALGSAIKNAGVLRRAVYQAASHGRLTDQRPDDGTAEELLAAVAADLEARTSAARSEKKRRAVLAAG